MPSTTTTPSLVQPAVVHEIPQKKQDPKVVACLERLLAEAREGTVKAVAVAWEYTDSGKGAGWQATGSLWHTALIGALEAVKTELTRELLDDVVVRERE